jgi:hypothetical protein
MSTLTSNQKNNVIVKNAIFLSVIHDMFCIPEYETIKSRVLYRIVQSFKKLLRNYQHNVEKYSVNGIQMTSEGIGNYMMTSEGINNYIFVLKLKFHTPFIITYCK